MTMMKEFPVVLLTATIWAYWIGVGVMVIRVRRQTRTLAGLVPEQSLERLMWRRTRVCLAATRLFGIACGRLGMCHAVLATDQSVLGTHGKELADGRE